MKGDFTRFTWDPKKNYSSVRMQQGRVQVDADWNEQAEILEHLRERGVEDLAGPCGAPHASGGFRVRPAASGEDLEISAGRLYVDGILCTAPLNLTYRTQEDLPGAPLPSELDPPPEPPAGRYLVYLDVWQRHLTALEDPSILERALGGPDTATRVKTVAQVKLLPAGAAAGAADCAVDPPGWQEATAPGSGRLRARTQPGAEATDPCIVPAQAGYTRLENQLYRVEVHEGGSLGGASFKWSRDNGAVVTAWLGQGATKPEELVVASTGPDKLTGFHDATWVELTDDTRELQGRPGLLLRVLRVEGDVIEVDPGDETLDRGNFPRNPKVRRWDLPAAADGPPAVTTASGNDGYLELESGIEIRFEEGTYRTGDHWVIPARAFVGEFSGDIEWPREGPDQGEARPPLGIRHHYCKLSFVDWDGDAFGGEPTDCRPLFPAVTELHRFYKLGGEGQEALPGRELPCPLRVAVTNGEYPVSGARVEFRLSAAAGELEVVRPVEAPDGSTVGATDEAGVAECRWVLPDSAAVIDGVPACLQVEARLLDSTLAAPAPVLSFSARISRADQVAYDPSACPPLAAAGVSNVQQAVDELCRNLGGDTPGIAVQAVRVLGDDIFVRNDEPLEPRRLARGLMIQCDRDVDPRAFQQEETDLAVPAKPSFTVALDLPYPLGGDNNFWDIGGIVGFQEVVLRARVDAEGPFIRWTPHPDTQRWLQETLFSRLMSPNAPIADRVLCRLTLKGNFIWEAGAGREPGFYLDGQVFGRPTDEGVVRLRFPSGDRRRGGDFEMWFWLQAEERETPGLTVTARANGSIVTGGVLDPSGAPLPGVAVTLANLLGGQVRTALTSANGTFTFREVPNGRYRVQASAGTLSGSTGVIVGGIIPDPIRPVPPIVTDVPGIGDVFGRRLEGAGIRTAREMADLNVDRLAEILEVPPTRAEALREAARRLLR